MEEGWYQKVLSAQKQGKYLEAKEYLVKGADSEDIKCMAYLGLFYTWSTIHYELCERNKWLRKAADAGDATAMVWLSEALSVFGSEGDEKRDLRWKVLESDDDYAKGYLYIQCYNNREKGVYFLKRSAEGGNMFAQSLLGDCYWYGNGVTKDERKALEWFQKSADQGFFQGQYNVGHVYETGRGADSNYSEAMYWYYLALKQGHCDSGSNYTVLCNRGFEIKWSVRNHVIFPRKFKNEQFTFLLCLKRNGIILPKELRKMIVYNIAKNRMLLPPVYDDDDPVSERNIKKIKLSK